MKKLKFMRLLIYIPIYLLLLINNGDAQSINVRNPSFENHLIGQYPTGRTKELEYSSNQLMKCIGFCGFPKLWPPSIDGKCNLSIIEPELGGWYWPSKNA